MAQGKYDDLARSILKDVGGVENINGVAHCITRLRLKLKDVDKADTASLEKTPGVIKVMNANGQYHVVLGNKVEDVYDAFLKESGLSGTGEVAADEEDATGEGKTAASVLIDLISGIFAPILATFSAAGIMKGILALLSFFFPAFAAGQGAYDVLYTVADGFFYFLPVALGMTAARKFKMSEFNGLAVGMALVYPTMVALTGGEVLGTVQLGILGTFSWYATFLGIPIIMPAAGYTSSVIPVLLMVWFASKVEHWVRGWMPASLKMFFTPLIVVTSAVVLGYLAIGPIATIINNLLSAFFNLLFSLPVVGSALGCLVVSAVWMPLVIFGFHWSLVPIAINNIGTMGYDFILASVIGHSFSLGAVVLAMYLKNRDEGFREIALPAMISAFFFGVTEPAIYGCALPDKKAFVNACIGSAVGGLIVGITGASLYLVGGLGVFNWLSFIYPASAAAFGAADTGISYVVIAIVASLASAVVGFVLEYATYRPQAQAK